MTTAGGADKRKRAEPAAAALVAAGRSHRVVLPGEIHGWAAEHRLLRSFLDSRELATVFDDIVVEFGNARHQRLVDAYVSGAEVSEEDVRRAWLETTQGSVWAGADYAAFFRAVRERNQRSGTQLRVILGDPPLPAAGARSGEHDFWVLQRGARTKAPTRRGAPRRPR